MKKMCILLTIFLVFISLVYYQAYYQFKEPKDNIPSGERWKPLTFEDIENFIEQFYEKFNSEDYGYIYNEMLAENHAIMDEQLEFIESNNYDDFEKFLQRVFQKLGPIKEKKAYRGKELYAPEEGIDSYIVIFQTTRENGVTMDTFTLKESNDSWLIEAYNTKIK